MSKLTAEQVVERLKTIRDLVRAGAKERSEHDRGYVEALDRAIEVVQCGMIESPDARRKRFETWTWSYTINHPYADQLRQGLAKADQNKIDMARQMLFVREKNGEYEDAEMEQAWITWSAAIDFNDKGDA